jgi:hypothetical protein
MYKISVSEEQFLTTAPEIRDLIKTMAEEYAEASVINWQYEYRYMIMTDENYFLARLKYDPILSAMKTEGI